jgi:hypothetical protein
LWAALLVCGQGQRIGTKRGAVYRHPACRLDGINVEQGTMITANGGGGFYGVQNPGFVIGKH